MIGPVSAEMVTAVERTLRIQEIAALRSRLIPDFRWYIEHRAPTSESRQIYAYQRLASSIAAVQDQASSMDSDMLPGNKKRLGRNWPSR